MKKKRAEKPAAAKPDKTIRQPFCRRLIKQSIFLFVRLLYRIEYHGLENIPAGGPLILIANHTHIADVPAIHCIMKPWISWVAKQELFGMPLIGRMVRYLGAIPVNRDRADLATARGIIRALREQEIVGMFPQGTRVPFDSLQDVPPRSGAAHFALKANVPILPVAVGDTFRIFRRVRVVFGPVFQLEKLPPGVKPDTRYLEDLSISLMQRVFDLVDREYPLKPGSQREDDPESGSGRKPEEDSRFRAPPDGR